MSAVARSTRTRLTKKVQPSRPHTRDRLALLALLVVAAITVFLVVRLFLHMP